MPILQWKIVAIITTSASVLSATNMAQYGVSKGVTVLIYQVPSRDGSKKMTLDQPKAKIMEIVTNAPGSVITHV